jgi:hypothetical protein
VGLIPAAGDGSGRQPFAKNGTILKEKLTFSSPPLTIFVKQQCRTAKVIERFSNGFILPISNACSWCHNDSYDASCLGRERRLMFSPVG